MSSLPGSERDDRFRRLFERVGTGITVMDADGCFLEVNPVFCDTVGYTSDELATMDYLSLTHPDDRAANLRLVEELLTGRRDSITVEKRYLTKSRGVVWVRATASLMHDERGDVQLIAATEDISAQKAVETQLEESQALLRIAGKVGKVGGWAIDTGPMTLSWSDEIHDLTGYPRGRTPALHEALDFYTDGDRRRVASAVDECIANGTPFDLECRFTPVGGEPGWVRVVGEPRLAPDGSVERVQGAVIDVTARKRAERDADVLTERLRTTMESITDALYTVDTDWRFTYVNERAQEILGHRADELLGRTVWEAFPAAAGRSLQAAYQLALDGNRTIVLDEYYYGPLGRYFGVNIYPSEQGLAVYFRDVTDKRNIRVELEQREARLAEQAALLDEAQDAIVVHDLDGRITYWNRSAERIYGWSADEAIGRTVDGLLGIDPTTYAAALHSVFEHGRCETEMANVSRSGRELVMEARWTLVRDADGRPASVLGIDTDVTQRKHMEQQLLRAQRVESIGEMAGGIAHDLNNALAPITMSIELLRAGETDPSKLRMLDLIATSAQHGARMVDQVLSFARGADGKREPIALAQTIEEVGRIAFDTFPKDIDIRMDVADDLWPVVGDATQIQQVLINLCVNARDAMPDGGTLTLRARNGELVEDGTSGLAGPAVTLLVTDTGVGIARDVMHRLFDPFFTTKPRGEGTGLGLATSTVIVASHGGRIDVSSEVGAGATFVVQLPAEPASIGLPRPEEPTIRRGSGELIVIVDDEESIREIASTVLRHFGYRVLLAADGAEAIAAVEANQAETAVILTDLMMPTIDGFAVIDTVRRLRPDVPIIASSGLDTAQSSKRSLDAGAVRFLAKPYDASTLLQVVGDALRHHPVR